MAGVNFDAANIGVPGGYGLGYGSNITDLAALGLIFGDGVFGGRRGHDDCGCCPPATCKDVNDVDRDVLKTGFDAQKGQWDVDRDVLLGDKCIEEKICDSTHKLEKDIFGVDKDVLLGFKEADHRIDMLKCKMGEGFAEVKGLIKETDLCRENKDLCRRNEKLQDVVLKQQTVSEILAALGVTPVIAANAASTG